MLGAHKTGELPEQFAWNFSMISKVQLAYASRNSPSTTSPSSSRPSG
jgi:hypothetical protein